MAWDDLPGSIAATAPDTAAELAKASGRLASEATVGSVYALLDPAAAAALASPASVLELVTSAGIAGALAAFDAMGDPFYPALAALGQRRRTNPEVFLNVWAVESGLNPAAINPNGGARGLNQMMPATLKNLGAPADFEKLSAVEQLPWIEKLIAYGEKLNGGPFRTAARYYWSNFYPGTMVRGDTPDAVVVSSTAPGFERTAYYANRGLDANKDGVITQGDLAAVLARVAARPFYVSARDKLRAAVRSLPAPGVTWPSDDPSGAGASGGAGAAVLAAAGALALLYALGGSS